MIHEDIETLCHQWTSAEANTGARLVRDVLEDKAILIDEFDLVRLVSVIRARWECTILSTVGRHLFATSRTQKKQR